MRTADNAFLLHPKRRMTGEEKEDANPYISLLVWHCIILPFPPVYVVHSMCAGLCEQMCSRTGRAKINR